MTKWLSILRFPCAHIVQSDARRLNGIERLFRDVQGARFHPWPEHKQHAFAGRIALGIDPV